MWYTVCMNKHTNYSKLKIQAIKLRKLGKSYSVISKKINTSKSTLSYWLKNIRLKPEHRKKLYSRQIGILNKGARSQKIRRQKEVDSIIQKAVLEIKHPISLDSFKLAGAFLYWGEGGKTRMFNITNSDPELILFMVKWLDKIFKIPPSQLTARLNIYPQQNEKKIKKLIFIF